MDSLSASTTTSPDSMRATRTTQHSMREQMVTRATSARELGSRGEAADGEKGSSAAWALLRSDLVESRRQLTELTIEAERLRAENARLRDGGQNGLERRFREETQRYQSQIDELRECLRAAEARLRSVEAERELIERKFTLFKEEHVSNQSAAIERMASEHVAALQRAEDEAARLKREVAELRARGEETDAARGEAAALRRALQAAQESGATDAGLLSAMRAYLLSRGLLHEGDPRLSAVGGAAAAIAAAAYGAAPPAMGEPWDADGEELVGLGPGPGFGGVPPSGGGFREASPTRGRKPGSMRAHHAHCFPWPDGPQQQQQQGGAAGQREPLRRTASAGEKSKQPPSRSRIGFLQNGGNGPPILPRAPGQSEWVNSLRSPSPDRAPRGRALQPACSNSSCGACGSTVVGTRRVEDIEAECARLREQLSTLVSSASATLEKRVSEGALLEAEMERVRKEAECREKLRHSRELERVKADAERDRAAVAARLATLEALLRTHEGAAAAHSAVAIGLATPGRR